MMKGGDLFIFAILFNMLKAWILLLLYMKRADYSTKPVTKDSTIDGNVHRMAKVQVRPRSTKNVERKLVSKGAISRKDKSK